MTLLAPSYLWGLLGLAIPIAIHLWSRKKMRIIKVGSTKFIAETKSRRSNSIQLNEWWLLILRCLIIALLVIIMAEPFTFKSSLSSQITYLFDPALLSSDQTIDRFKSIPKDGRRILAPGFPEWEDGVKIFNNKAVTNYWQLAREMEGIETDSIIVFTPAFAKALKGKRPTLSKNINWITVDQEATIDRPIVAYEVKDSIEILSLSSSAETSKYSRKRISKTAIKKNTTNDSIIFNTAEGRLQVPIMKLEPLTIALNKSPTTENQWEYLQAALKAIEKYSDRTFTITPIDSLSNSQIDSFSYVIHLQDGNLRSHKPKILRYQPDQFSKKLIEQGASANEFLLTKKLTPKVVYDYNLVESVFEWLALDQEILRYVNPYDMRTVSSDQIATKVSKNAELDNKKVKADLSTPFWILIVLLLISERVLSKIRKQ